jgi:hypothetical protein
MTDARPPRRRLTVSFLEFSSATRVVKAPGSSFARCS